MLKIAVIGTAGRGSDYDRLKVGDFERMCDITHTLISTLTSDAYLISGGAAWADHVAVKLFLEKRVPNLHLYLSAKFNLSHNQFEETQAGRISNYYHKKFSNKACINSFSELNSALRTIQSDVSNGFFARNNLVANAQAVIAFTFGEKQKLKDGGTANTFKQYLKRTSKNISYHIDLNDWKIYTPAEL